MADPSNDDRPPVVIAMQWASQIMTIGMEMALPGALGYWLDLKWRTGPWLLVVGVGLGAVVSFLHLLQLVRVFDKSKKRPRPGQRKPRL